MRAGKDPLGHSIKPFVAMYPSERDSWISLRKRGQEIVRYGKPTYPTPADAAVGLQFETAAKEFAARMKSRSQKHSLSGRPPVVGTPFMPRAIQTGRNMFMPVPDPATPQKMAWAPTKDYFVGGENLTRAQLNRYPTDPKAMYERMAGRVRKGNAAFVARQARQHHPIPKTIDPNTAVWRYLTDPSLASTPTLPPNLRAGLVRALGEIPGVIATEAKDSIGRGGTAFTFTRDGIRNEAIYDPRTSALLSLKSTLVDPASASPIEFKRLPPGVLLKSYLLVEQKTVNREPPSAFPPVTAHRPSDKQPRP
ncbi:MAG: hypothetical protein JJE27_06175 [Thermoleophilia bacterium]|nr:hypothetical protein [Thermoleophilia bacterium]